MSTHTPGPWRLLPEEMDRPYIRVRGTRLGDRYKIANVLMPSYEGSHEQEAQETRANARLMAASPALLAELRLAHEIITALQNMIPEGRKVDMCKALSTLHDGEGAVRYHERAAAIAAATGAQP